jgi:hypothetical protein
MNVIILVRFMGLKQRLGVTICFSQLESHLDFLVLPRVCLGDVWNAVFTSWRCKDVLEWPEPSLSPHGSDEFEESDRELFALSIWMSMSDADTECSSSRQDMKHWRLLRFIVYCVICCVLCCVCALVCVCRVMEICDEGEGDKSWKYTRYELLRRNGIVKVQTWGSNKNHWVLPHKANALT